MKKDAYIIHTDGGARGNPGPAAVGVVVTKNGKPFHQFGKCIGETTNNVAEYAAVIEALTYLKEQNVRHANIAFVLDSTLVVNQLNGLFKIKDTRLRELMVKVMELEAEIGEWVTYESVPREKNRDADSLVNFYLDGTPR